MVRLEKEGRHLIRAIRRSWPTLLFAAALGAAFVRAALPARTVTLDVLDVGQGDAVLIQDGRTQMLIDGGPDGAVLSALGETMPFFDRTIEVVVLTHPHADHYGGLIQVFERLRVLRVLHSGRAGEGEEYAAFSKALAQEGAEVHAVSRGDGFTLETRTRVDVLWPPASGAGRDAVLQDADPNAASVVLRMSAPGGSALLTGDATATVEEALLASGMDLHADVLKVAHHGSAYSSGSAFLAAVRPQFAAISLGEKNRYGHPGWSVLRRIRTAGASVFRTDTDGTVRFRFSPEGVVAQPRDK